MPRVPKRSLLGLEMRLGPNVKYRTHFVCADRRAITHCSIGEHSKSEGVTKRAHSRAHALVMRESLSIEAWTHFMQHPEGHRTCETQLCARVFEC